MLNIYSLLKYYIVVSLLWFVFMLRIIIERLVNHENVNDVFGVSLLDTALFGFASISITFAVLFLSSNKIYFHNNKFSIV